MTQTVPLSLIKDPVLILSRPSSGRAKSWELAGTISENFLPHDNRTSGELTPFRPVAVICQTVPLWITNVPGRCGSRLLTTVKPVGRLGEPGIAWLKLNPYEKNISA